MQITQSELTVITKAKDLCSYIVTVTQKSPKQFRFTFTSRLQNLSLNVIENLYRANDTFVTKENLGAREKRLVFQHQAMTDLKLLCHFSLLAQKSNKQMEAEKRTVQGELHAAEMRLELLPKLLKNLYEDKVSGRMMEEGYAILSREYAEEREGLKKKVMAHRDRLRRIEQSEGEREQFIKAIRKFMEMRTLTNQILRELIDHIDVYEVEGRGKNRTQRMVIYYKFVGYLEIPSHLSAPNYKADLRQGVAVEYVSCEPTESARELFDEEYEAEAEKE